MQTFSCLAMATADTMKSPLSLMLLICYLFPTTKAHADTWAGINYSTVILLVTISHFIVPWQEKNSKYSEFCSKLPWCEVRHVLLYWIRRGQEDGKEVTQGLVPQPFRIAILQLAHTSPFGEGENGGISYTAVLLAKLLWRSRMILSVMSWVPKSKSAEAS